MELLQTSFFLSYMLFFSIFAGLLWFYYYIGLYLFDTPIPKRKYYGRAVAVIPCYNEDEENMIDTINCIKNCEELYDYVFVDDGSSKVDLKSIFEEHLESEHYLIHTKNKGKREAQATGLMHFKQKYGDSEIHSVVMLDSDTTFEEGAIYKLLQKMQMRDVGAVTANVQVKNRTDNLLTRALSAMYWSSSNIWRQAPSNYGYMQVTNGQLSVYRARCLYKLLPEYLTQTFCGNKCAFSDDRWFTQHIQTDFGYKVYYEKDAIAYTYVPNRLKQCWKMFMRWKKGSLRETLLVSKHISTHPLLVLDCWWNHLVSIFQLTIRLIVIILAFYHPIVILHYLAVVMLISVVYGLAMLFENPRELPFRLVYSLYNEFIFGWIIICAIYDIKNQSWRTR